jgi:hypothetical protein
MYKLVRTTGVEVVGDHRLSLSFEDGRTGEVDFSGLGWTGVFAPLEDPAYFARVELGLGTIVWPNDADIAPETLYHWATEGISPTPRR